MIARAAVVVAERGARCDVGVEGPEPVGDALADRLNSRASKRVPTLRRGSRRNLKWRGRRPASRRRPTCRPVDPSRSFRREPWLGTQHAPRAGRGEESALAHETQDPRL